MLRKEHQSVRLERSFAFHSDLFGGLHLTHFFFLFSSSTEKDYYKVFPERKKAKVEKRGDDHVYEVGADGVDISD